MLMRPPTPPHGFMHNIEMSNVDKIETIEQDKFGLVTKIHVEKQDQLLVDTSSATNQPIVVASTTLIARETVKGFQTKQVNLEEEGEEGEAEVRSDIEMDQQQIENQDEIKVEVENLEVKRLEQQIVNSVDNQNEEASKEIANMTESNQSETKTRIDLNSLPNQGTQNLK
jgi:hypothetical protein